MIFRLLIVNLNSMNQANQDPLTQIIIWDQTFNKVRTEVMRCLRDPNSQARIQWKLFITSNLGFFMEVTACGWVISRRRRATRVFVLLREGLDFDINSIEKNIQGTFQVNFKHFI